MRCPPQIPPFLYTHQRDDEAPRDKSSREQSGAHRSSRVLPWRCTAGQWGIALAAHEGTRQGKGNQYQQSGTTDGRWRVRTVMRSREFHPATEIPLKAITATVPLQGDHMLSTQGDVTGKGVRGRT